MFCNLCSRSCVLKELSDPYVLKQIMPAIILALLEILLAVMFSEENPPILKKCIFSTLESSDFLLAVVLRKP